jgi:hypothetical protein
VEWQFWQLVLVRMCVGPLPVAVVPLWQETQLADNCVWSTRSAGFQLTVLWQASQLLVDAMCVRLFPVSLDPSWQLTQFVVTPACVKLAGSHVFVVWQAPQSAVVTIWVAVFLSAM